MSENEPTGPSLPPEAGRPGTERLRAIAHGYRFLSGLRGYLLECADWIDAQPRSAAPVVGEADGRLTKAVSLLHLTRDRADVDGWRPIWFANYVTPFLTAAAAAPSAPTPTGPGDKMCRCGHPRSDHTRSGQNFGGCMHFPTQPFLCGCQSFAAAPASPTDGEPRMATNAEIARAIELATEFHRSARPAPAAPEPEQRPTADRETEPCRWCGATITFVEGGDGWCDTTWGQSYCQGSTEIRRIHAPAVPPAVEPGDTFGRLTFDKHGMSATFPSVPSPAVEPSTEPIPPKSEWS